MGWRRHASVDDGECGYVEATTPPPRSVSLGTAFGLSSVSALLAAFTTALVLAPRSPQPPQELSMDMAATAQVASEKGGLHARRDYLFADLSAAETRTVATFVAEKTGCATGYPQGAEPYSRCFLSGSEAVKLHLPDKDQALAHLDGGAPAPPRMAESIVVHPERPMEEGVGIYLVGPLDGAGGLAPGASVKLSRWLHFNRRPVDQGDVTPGIAIEKVVKALKPLLLESFGPIFPMIPESYAPEEAGSVYNLATPAVMSTVRTRISRCIFNWFKDPTYFQVNWMHPLPFSFEIVHEGSPQEWYGVNISYCGQMFPTVPDLLAKDAQGQVQRCVSKQTTSNTWEVEGPDAGTEAAAETLPRPPPINKTWSIHGRGGISWGEWEMLASVRPASGLALYDIQWRGERILYELALNDAHAYYSTPRPEKQFWYSDKAFSLAMLSGDMVTGLDCPEGGTLLDGVTWVIPQIRKKAVAEDVKLTRPVKLICVFESNGYEGSMWRHAQTLSRKVKGRRQRVLVVRSVSTVGNYDYISEVRFAEDGSMKVRNEFAGYPETDLAAPFSQGSSAGRRIRGGSVPKAASLNWGNRAHGDLVAYLHAHFAVWKVDLDVKGRLNDFHRLKSTVETREASLPKKVQVVQHVKKEDPEMVLAANAATPGLWRIVNSDAINPVNGVPRGYAVVIESAPALQTLPKDHPFSIAGSFAKRHLTVTKRKETEPDATHSMDHYAATEPLLSVDKFLSDRESLVKQDLVCWVSLGKEHVTRPEDIPVVSNFGVQFALMPWSYSEENPGMQLPMSEV